MDQKLDPEQIDMLCRILNPLDFETLPIAAESIRREAESLRIRILAMQGHSVSEENARAALLAMPYAATLSENPKPVFGILLSRVGEDGWVLGHETENGRPGLSLVSAIRYLRTGER